MNDQQLRERSEAILDRLYLIQDRDAHCERADRAESERDEARAEVERLKHEEYRPTIPAANNLLERTIFTLSSGPWPKLAERIDARNRLIEELREVQRGWPTREPVPPDLTELAGKVERLERLVSKSVLRDFGWMGSSRDELEKLALEINREVREPREVTEREAK